MVIAKFGIWEVNEDGLTAKKESFSLAGDYHIGTASLWSTRKEKDNNDVEVEVWDYSIHLLEKSWMNTKNIDDFNKALVYAQEYHKKSKPENMKEVSTEKTLEIQQKYIEIHKKINDSGSLF